MPDRVRSRLVLSFGQPSEGSFHANFQAVFDVVARCCSAAAAGRRSGYVGLRFRSGDACDDTPFGGPDTDGDGIPDSSDPTPDGDTDDDGIDNLSDPTPNGDQDGDGIGDACDEPPVVDADTAGIADEQDECPDDPTNTCVLAAENPQVAVIFQATDSVGGNPVEFYWLQIAPDNGGPGLGTLIFDTQPSEIGTYLANCTAIVTLPPGDYEVVPISYDFFYYRQSPTPFTVAEGMGTVSLTLEQRSFVNFSFVNDTTGTRLSGSSSNACVQFLDPFSQIAETYLCDNNDSVVDGYAVDNGPLPVGPAVFTASDIPGYDTPDPITVQSSPAKRLKSSCATFQSSCRPRSFPTIATRCA